VGDLPLTRGVRFTNSISRKDWFDLDISTLPSWVQNRNGQPRRVNVPLNKMPSGSITIISLKYLLAKTEKILAKKI
jgi:hypothetical protein